MSLALGKNSVNVNQPLHLDNTNHLLVNDSTNKAVLDQIATNTANINVNVDENRQVSIYSSYSNLIQDLSGVDFNL